MSVDAVTTFFALLAVLALAGVVVAAVTWVVSVARGGAPGWAREARAAVAPVAVPLAGAVALTSTLGSLYLSEVAKYPPCILCWYQRIAMYPLALTLLIAALRRERDVRWYVVPPALIGLGIAIYHYLIERFPDSVSFSCSADVPCSTVWVWKFHFLSIPGMAGVGFAAVIALVLLAGSSGADRSPGPGTGHDDDPVAPPSSLQETSA
jgi:disulfide bond formation protein DsbB